MPLPRRKLKTPLPAAHAADRLLQAPCFPQELAQTYRFDKKGEVGPGEKPYLELPVLSVYKVSE